MATKKEWEMAISVPDGAVLAEISRDWCEGKEIVSITKGNTVLPMVLQKNGIQHPNPQPQPVNFLWHVITYKSEKPLPPPDLSKYQRKVNPTSAV